MKPLHTALTRTTYAPDTKARQLLADTSVGLQRRILWIDGVGGYLLIERDDVLVGQAVSGSPLDVCIVGDLSRQACAIKRIDGDYLVQPLQAMLLDGRSIEKTHLLHHDAVLQLGNRVKLKFTKPNPLSATARLDLLSLNHFKPHVDGVLLLADSCVLGPSGNSHVVCPTWKSELLIYRQAGAWQFRSLGEVDVNGTRLQGTIPLVAGMRMQGADFSLSIE